MIALPNAKSHGLTAGGGGGALALTGMSAAKAEPEIIASAVAAKTIFFMTIPITFQNPVSFRMPPGRTGLLTGCNLERGGTVVKQKTQASAAFLGVCGILRKVVGVCCIPTTNLPDCDGPCARQHAKTGRADASGESLFPSLRIATPGLETKTKRPRLVGAAALAMAG